jgi:hypothetical protein
MTEKNFSADARGVFEVWKDVMKHPRSHLDEKRLRLIVARLKEGYAQDDLILAIVGCSASKFHMGENDGGKVYDSIELIFRDAGKVDWFVNLGEQEINRRRMALKQEEAQREADLARSVRGPGYEAARGKIMELVKKERAA